MTRTAGKSSAEGRSRLGLSHRAGAAAAILLSAALLAPGCNRGQAPAKVGFAQREISSIGSTRPDYSLHDSLYAKVVWVENGAQSFGIVSLDMIELPDSECAAIRQGVADSLGLDAVRVTVCPSHTHSGFAVDCRRLAQRVGSIARQARQAAQPAQVGYCRIEVGPGLVVNRRIAVNDAFGDLTMVYCRNNRILADGLQMDVRGQVDDFIARGEQILSSEYADREGPGAARAVGPSPQAAALLDSLPQTMLLDGPVDPHLEALCFKSLSGEVLGSLVRFACHATSFRGSRTRQYSADYPGVLCRAVSEATGGAQANFLQGPCGDTKPFIEQNGEKPMIELGTRLGRLLTAQLEMVQYQPLTGTFWKQEVQSFGVAPDMAAITEEMRVKAEEDFNRMAATAFDPYALKKLHDWSVRAWASQYLTSRDSLRLPFTVTGFNQVALVFLPGELFARHSLTLKERFPGRQIMVVELADTDSPFYVPTREAFPRGGYEAGNASLPAGSGERMVDICTQLLGGFFQ